MVNNNPESEHNNPKKGSQLRKIFDGMKKFIKKEEEEDKNPASFRTSKNEKNQESNQQLGSSKIPKLETPETQEAEKSMRKRKANIKEQKLPKKYRKGW